MNTISTLLQTNINRVFNERDGARRLSAIKEIYAADATLYEEKATYSGHEAIAGAVTELIQMLPPTMTFAITSVMENHDVGKLIWRGLLPDGTTVVTGTDVARIESKRIRSIHVFVDSAQ